MTLAAPSMLRSRSCTPRFATRRRRERETFGPELAAVADALGTPFMPWQRMVADVGGEIHPETGLPAYHEIVVTVPRQSGKTTLFLAWQIHRCTSPRWEHPQRSVFTGQSGKDARDKWLDELFPLIDRSRLKPLVQRMNRGMGNESVLWRTGSLIRLLSTSPSSGHSKTLHQAVLDEIWHDRDWRREQGLRPAMITIADKQVLVCSTAGDDESIVLSRKVERGRKAVERDSGEGVAYFEFRAPDEWDPADEESYFGFMPALCPDPPCRCDPQGKWRHTVTLTAVRGERDDLEPPEFARAYGNIPTSLMTDEFESVIPLSAWRKLHDPQLARPDGRVALALDMTPDRSWISIGAAVRIDDSRVHVEAVEHHPAARCGERGCWCETASVPLRVAAFAERNDVCVVVLDTASPAASMADKLRAAIGDDRVVLTSARQMADACGEFYDAAVTRTLHHVDDFVLNDALAFAAKRDLGDGAWAWSRKTSTADISPLVAVTLAHYGLQRFEHAGDDEETFVGFAII